MEPKPHTTIKAVPQDAQFNNQQTLLSLTESPNLQRLNEEDAKESELYNLRLLAECCAVVSMVNGTSQPGKAKDNELPSENRLSAEFGLGYSSLPYSDACTVSHFDRIPNPSILDNVGPSLSTSYCYSCGNTRTQGAHHYCEASGVPRITDAFVTPSPNPDYAYSRQGSSGRGQGFPSLLVNTPTEFSQETDDVVPNTGPFAPGHKPRYHHSKYRGKSFSVNRKSTAFELNKLFYEILGANRKITHADRRKIEKKTGVAWKKLSRGITYRKRQHKDELNLYKKLVSDGYINGYKSFVAYRKSQGISGLSEYQSVFSSFSQSKELELSEDGGADLEVNIDEV